MFLIEKFYSCMTIHLCLLKAVIWDRNKVFAHACLLPRFVNRCKYIERNRLVGTNTNNIITPHFCSQVWYNLKPKQDVESWLRLDMYVDGVTRGVSKNWLIRCYQCVIWFITMLCMENVQTPSAKKNCYSIHFACSYDVFCSVVPQLTAKQQASIKIKLKQYSWNGRGHQEYIKDDVTQDNF